MDDIYCYIADHFKEIDTAENMADALEEGIYSLETFPCRGAERKIGAFAHKGYRQIHVHNFTVVYRIDEQGKSVIIVTVRYAMSSF